MSEPFYERSLRAWAERRGVRWERLRYARPDAGGEVVAHRLIPPAPPRAIVLPVHGAGNDALFSFPGLFKRLLLSGYEIFAFDLDGHGRGSTTVFDPARVHGAVPAALRESGAQERGLPVHSFGVSLGGSILLRALGELPDRFASAALLAAPLRIELGWRSIARELGLPLLRVLWRERRHCGTWGLIPAFGPLKRSTYPLRLAVPPGPGAFGYVDVLNATLRSFRLEEIAPGVRAPVLLVYGTRDRIVPIVQADRLDALLPRSELLRLEGETHLTAPLAPAATGRLLEWIGAHER